MSSPRPTGGGSDPSKLPLTGGTLTGALTAPNIRVTSLTTSITPAFGFTDAAATGWYSPNNGTVYFGGASRGITLGLNRASLGAITIGYSSRIDFCSGAADAGTLDLFVGRSAAATLQLGVNAASTATAQTIKAHDVTTGAGANLNLSGGTGSTATGSVLINSNAIFDTNCRLTFPNSSSSAATGPGIGNWVGALGIFGTGGALAATVSSSGINFGNTMQISFGSSAFIRGPSAATFHLGQEVASGWISQTLSAAGGRIGIDANNSPTNTLTIAGSVSTGTGTGGNLRLGVYGTNGSSGSAIGTLNTVLTVVAARKVINLAGIPTSSAGLSSGDVYSNAGVLMIVP